MLQYYRLEEKAEDKILSEYEIDTYAHISDQYKEFTKRRVEMVNAFVNSYAQDFYEYFATKSMLDELNYLTNWEKDEYKGFNPLLSIKGKVIKSILRSRFKKWSDCIRIIVSYQWQREFAEGRELKGGITGVDFYEGEKVGWAPIDSTRVFETISNPKIREKFMVSETEHVIGVGVPVIFNDHYVCDLIVDFYKL